MEIKAILDNQMAGLSAPSTQNAEPTTTATIDWEFNTLNDPKLIELQGACQRFCNEIKSGLPPRWLSLLGPSGTGKSHMAKKAYRWVADFGCRYTHETGARLSHRVKRIDWRRAASNIREGDWGYVSDLKEVWFLFIDDFGSEHQGGTGIVRSVAEEIIDARLGKWTIITSNLSRGEMASQIDPRIASRLKRQGGVVVNMKGVDDYHERR